MTPKTTPGTASAPPRVGEALGLFAVTLLLLLVVGSIAQRHRPGALAVAATDLVAVLIPALLWSRVRRHHVLTRLGLWPLPPARILAGVAGGLLLGAAWFYLVSLAIEPHLERLVPMSERERRQLLHLLLPPGGPRPLWQDLACFAAAPALCEEVLFRGVLLPVLTLRLRRRVGHTGGALLALLASSLLFGAFHFSAAKLLPTAVLGLGFGLAVLTTGALWPAVAMHFANNTLVILLCRAGQDEPPRPSTGGPGLHWLLLMVAAAACGAALLDRPGRERNSPPQTTS